MSALAFTLKAPPRQRVDLSPLTPDRLRDVAPGDIARIELASGNRRIAVGELFTVVVGDPGEIVIRNATSLLDFIGRDMRGGTIRVEGDAGAYLGQSLRGGRLRVSGSVGPWAAAEMQGGSIAIAGDAGDFLGGALPGAMRGMSGGVVAVRGRAGLRAADRMRRGIIVVHGAVGAYAGSRMVAGTVAVMGGGSGAYPGLGMKRGTLIFRELPQSVLPSFVDCGTHDLGFLALLDRTLRDLDSGFGANEAYATRVRRYVGDLAADGKGEILVWR